MSGWDKQLAVLLRKAQWMLDDAAFEVGGGRFSSADREALAEALDELAETLREYGVVPAGGVEVPAPANPGQTGRKRPALDRSKADQSPAGTRVLR